MARSFISLSFLVVFALRSPAAEPKFTPGKHDQGELRIVNGLPVLVVQGTPAQIGEQFGTLAVKQAKPLLGVTRNYMKQIGLEKAYPLMLIAAGNLLKTCPPDQAAEIEAAAKVSGVDRDLIVMLNAFPDLMKIGGCSTLIVEPKRSKTDGVLYGRLLDWPPFEGVPEHTLVTIIRPKGKHACAVVTIPPILGAISGMNDAGLCIAINQIDASKDASPRLNIAGTPTLLLLRKVLEECTTVAEAEKLLNREKRMIWCSLTVCDKQGGCVLEVTPKMVVRRNAEQGVCCCTNHFRTADLVENDRCRRYDLLEKVQNSTAKLGVADVAKELHKVNQKYYTIHAIIFEPATRNLHLSIGVGRSATETPLTKLELGKLLEEGFRE